MAKKIIGLVGEMGSGKDTFCDFVKSNYQNVYIMKFSDALTDILKMFLDSVKREDQQWLSLTLRERFGQDILLKALIKKINAVTDGIVILNGVRRPGDLEAVKMTGGKVVYITADEKVRWERVVIRKEKSDDDVPFEKFQELGKAEAEVHIHEVGKMADLAINNNGSKEEFYNEIKKLVDSI